MFDLLAQITNEYFLKSLGSIRSNSFNLNYFKSLDKDQFLNYAEGNLKYLGAGSSRATFILSSSKVLKIAINDAGVAQNEIESKIYNKFKNINLVTKIFDQDSSLEWIISELVRPLNSYSEFISLSGFNLLLLDEYIQAERDFDIYTLEQLSTKARDIIDKIIQIEDATGLIEGDLIQLNSWGVNTDNDLRLLDYGFDYDVMTKFYTGGAKPRDRGVNV